MLFGAIALADFVYSAILISQNVVGITILFLVSTAAELATTVCYLEINMHIYYIRILRVQCPIHIKKLISSSFSINDT